MCFIQGYGGFSTFVDMVVPTSKHTKKIFLCLNILVIPPWWPAFVDAFDPPKNQYWVRLFMMKRAQRKSQKGRKKDLIGDF